MATHLPRYQFSTLGRSALRGITLSILMIVAVTGCQVQNKPTVAQLPPPSFDGPKIARPGTAVPGPLAAAPSGPSSWAPKVPPRPWKWIVIHHSASPTGSMAIFDQEHRAKGWDGVGYHFVIGNGTNSGDGQVEVTPRWTSQKWGAHAKTPDNQFNDFGIGICLVGNFDNSRPTARQLQSLEKLVDYLTQTYHLSPRNIVGHGSVHAIAHGGTATECPGRYMDVAAVRSQAAQALAARGVTPADSTAQTASGVELLGDVSR